MMISDEVRAKLVRFMADCLAGKFNSVEALAIALEELADLCRNQKDVEEEINWAAKNPIV